MLGGSNSLFCIKDPNELSHLLFPHMTSTQKYDKLKELMLELDQSGIGCMVDIVLNHCAYDTEFIEQHPEAGYNLINSPYLTAAYELDKALHEFTKLIISKSLPNLHNKNKIENEKDLTIIMQILKLEILPPLRLQQFFQMDVSAVLKNFEENTEEEDLSPKVLEDLKTKGLEYFLKTFALVNEGEGRFFTKLNTKMV